MLSLDRLREVTSPPKNCFEWSWSCSRIAGGGSQVDRDGKGPAVSRHCSDAWTLPQQQLNTKNMCVFCLRDSGMRVNISMLAQVFGGGTWHSRSRSRSRPHKLIYCYAIFANTYYYFITTRVIRIARGRWFVVECNIFSKLPTGQEGVHAIQLWVRSKRSFKH